MKDRLDKMIDGLIEIASRLDEQCSLDPHVEIDSDDLGASLEWTVAGVFCTVSVGESIYFANINRDLLILTHFFTTLDELLAFEGFYWDGQPQTKPTWASAEHGITCVIPTVEVGNDENPGIVGE